MEIMKNDTTMSAPQEENHPITDWFVRNEWWMLFCPMPMATIGAITNCFTYILASNMEKATSTVSVLKYMAIVEAMLSFDLIRVSLEMNKILETTVMHWFPCKFFNTYHSGMSVAAEMGYVLLALDRAIAVNFGVFYKLNGNVKNGGIVAVITFLVAMGSQAPFFYYYHLYNDDGYVYCYIAPEGYWYLDFSTYAWYIVGPLAAILVLNFMICFGLLFRRKSRKPEDVKLSLMLMFMALFYSIFYALLSSLWELTYGTPVFYVYWSFQMFFTSFNTSANFAVFLLLPSMRRALLKGIGCNTGST